MAKRKEKEHWYVFAPRYDGSKCRVCGKLIDKGDVVYRSSYGRMVHQTCGFVKR